MRNEAKATKIFSPVLVSFLEKFFFADFSAIFLN